MNLQYHIHESSIKCPYCDKESENYDYEVDQDAAEFECGHCEKIFWAEMNFVYSTHSDCGLNGDEHEWIQGTQKTVFQCKNCAQYKVEIIASAMDHLVEDKGGLK
jgi:sarcosine oxidase delta subunit